MNRRTVLRRIGVVLTPAIAGCSDSGGNGDGGGGGGGGTPDDGGGGTPDDGGHPCIHSASKLSIENVQQESEDGDVSFTGEIVNNFDDVVRLSKVWTHDSAGDEVEAIAPTRIRLLLPGERRDVITQGFDPADGEEYELRPTRSAHCAEYEDGINLVDHGLTDRGYIAGSMENGNDEDLAHVGLFARVYDADGSLHRVLRQYRREGLATGESWDFAFDRYTVDGDESYELKENWARLLHEKYYDAQ